jgi:hypothetical protein
MKYFNLAELFSSLVGAGVRRAHELGEDPGMAGAATTVRLSPEVRRFYEAQAETFGGASLSAIIAMTLEGVMRATKGEVDAPAERNRRTVDVLRDRFAYVYQAHEVDPTTLVELLRPHGFSLAALRDETQLINLLTDPVVDETAERFNVRRDWLLGRGPCTEEAGTWYKSPGNVCRRVIELTAAGLRPEVICVRRERAEFERAFAEGDGAPEEPVGLLIETQVTTEAGKKFPRYELWEFQRWNYPKCRLYFKALVRWLVEAQKQRLLGWRGVELSSDILRGLRAGDLLPVDAMKARRSGGAWYPDDYTDSSERSVCAKETEELRWVEEIYRECRLDERIQ